MGEVRGRRVALRPGLLDDRREAPAVGGPVPGAARRNVLSPVQRRWLALTGVVAVAATALFAVADRSPSGATGDESILGGASNGGESEIAAPAPDVRRRATRALEAAVAAGPRRDGRLEIALMEEGWPAPIVRTSDGRRTQTLRAWSVAKAVTAVALLQRMG